MKLIELVDTAFTLLMQSQVEIPPKSCKNLSNQAGDVTYTGRILPP